MGAALFGAHNSSDTPNLWAVNGSGAKTKADAGRDRGAGNPRHESRCDWAWFQHRGAADATDAIITDLVWTFSWK